MVKDNLKKNPAQIIGLSECEKEGEELLRAPGYAGDKTAPASSLAYRDAYQYLTIRANLDAGVLIGVRMVNAIRLQLLFWEHHYHGEYWVGTGEEKHKRPSRSQIMIARITLVHEMKHIGTAVAVMVVHMHNIFASNTVKGTGGL